MKKIALLLLMFVAFQVSAQDFHFLPKIGLNLANMTNSDGSMKPGLNVGVAAEFSCQILFDVLGCLDRIFTNLVITTVKQLEYVTEHGSDIGTIDFLNHK